MCACLYVCGACAVYIICFTICFFKIEALWQPARKTAATENRRPIYVFSTDLANSAADAVLKNRYDSIVQFHNAQPKGPGFLCLSKKEKPKKEEVNNTCTTSDSENEREEPARAPKRRSSRLSDDTPTTKKLRSSGQTKASEDSKRTRFSRRLRKQQQASSSPPSSATSEHSSSDESHHSPPQSHRGRGSGRAGRGTGGRRMRRGRGRARRNSSPLATSGRRQGGEAEGEREPDLEEAVEDEEGPSGEKEEGGGMDTSKDSDKAETQEEDYHKRPTGSGYDKKSQSFQDPTQGLTSQASLEQQPVEEENNYTICHGTPRSKGGVAVSSPSLSQASAQQKSSFPAGVSCAPSALSHPTQHDIVSLGLVDKQQKQMSSDTVAGVGDPMLSGQHPHPNLHKDAAPAPNNWPGGLGAQFHHVPSGYYGAGIHPMHYPPHATQHVPSANYSYGVYPWGAHPVGQPSREHHPYESLQQHGRPGVSQSGGSPHAHSPHVAYQNHPYAAHHPRSSSSAPTEPASSSSQGNESAGGGSLSTASHDKQPLPATQAHHTQSPASLHQLSDPASAAPISQVQHAAFTRPSHAALTTEQISAVHHPASAAFPYGFDPSNPAALSHMHHLWQQQHQHQIRAAGGVHPSHLPPHLQHTATGMWYAPHMQHLMQQHGGGIPDDAAKRRAALVAQQSVGAKPHPQLDATTALRMNSNRNNSNDSDTLHSSPLLPSLPHLSHTSEHTSHWTTHFN